MSRTNTAIDSALNQRMRLATTLLRDLDGKPIYTMQSAANEAVTTWLTSKQPDINQAVKALSTAPRSKRINHKPGSTNGNTKTQ